MADVVILINIDENGFMIEPVEVDLLDEQGNRNPLLDSPYLVEGDSTGGFWRPKWDFEKLMWTEGDPETALKMKKQEKKLQFKTECNELIEAGFVYEDMTFYFDKDSQADFTMQLTYTNAGLAPDEIAWKTMDKGVKIFNREQFFSICQAAHDHYRENKGALWKLEAYIDGITSLDELNSLTDFESSKKLVNAN
jgi:hypothetical protein